MPHVWIFNSVCDIHATESEFNCMVHWCSFHVWVLREGIEGSLDPNPPPLVPLKIEFLEVT